MKEERKLAFQIVGVSLTFGVIAFGILALFGDFLTAESFDKVSVQFPDGKQVTNVPDVWGLAQQLEAQGVRSITIDADLIFGASGPDSMGIGGTRPSSGQVRLESQSGMGNVASNFDLRPNGEYRFTRVSGGTDGGIVRLEPAR